MDKIVIQSFNPYESLYPGRKVITREQLDLIKFLKSKGYEVVVESKNPGKLHFITRKGEWDFLNDPIVISIFEDYLRPIVLGLVSAWIYNKLKGKEPSKEASNIFVELKSDDSKKVSSAFEHEVSYETYKNIQVELRKKQKAFEKVMYQREKRLQNLETEYIWPVFIDHTEKHVGWAKVWENESGLMTSTKIFDEETFKQIKNDDLKGLSITALVNDSECTICGLDYTECLHIGLEEYDGAKCGVLLKEMDLCELSVVNRPTNPLARIEYIDNNV